MSVLSTTIMTSESNMIVKVVLRNAPEGTHILGVYDELVENNQIIRNYLKEYEGSNEDDLEFNTERVYNVGLV